MNVTDFNFELPAHAHGKKDAIRTVYEYADFLESLLGGTGVGKDVYPEGVAVLCPVESMSDDFSMAISGIPSMVNDFTSGQFMETTTIRSLTMTTITTRRYTGFIMSCMDVWSWHSTGRR